MPSSAPEQSAREKIDAVLVAGGWLTQDYNALNLGAAGGTAVREVKLKSGPLEVFLFLRDVRSRVYFEQMEGRGTRVLTPSEMQAVSGEAARTKDHFVIVDAVGVCDSDKTESRPMECLRTVALEKMLKQVAFGDRCEDTLTSIASPNMRMGSRRAGTGGTVDVPHGIVYKDSAPLDETISTFASLSVLRCRRNGPWIRGCRFSARWPH